MIFSDTIFENIYFKITYTNLRTKSIISYILMQQFM